MIANEKTLPRRPCAIEITTIGHSTDFHNEQRLID